MFQEAFRQDQSDERPVEHLNGDSGEDEDEEAPLLFVDVNLGPSEQKRIVVFEGDDARSLAEQFCGENDLDDDTCDKLEHLLKQQIAAVLCRIDENDDYGEGSGSNEDPQVNDYLDAESGIQSSIKDETEDSLPNQRDGSLEESMRQSSHYRRSLMQSSHDEQYLQHEHANGEQEASQKQDDDETEV